jgi:hypothetical protein
MNAIATMGMRILGGFCGGLPDGRHGQAQQIVEPDDPTIWPGFRWCSTSTPKTSTGKAIPSSPSQEPAWTESKTRTSRATTTDYVIQYGKYGGDPWAGFFYHTEAPD